MIAYCTVTEAAGGNVHVDPFEAYAFGKHSELFYISEEQVTWYKTTKDSPFSLHWLVGTPWIVLWHPKLRLII